MKAVSPRLARRIDRLSRHAHAFHRYAHHPLCGAYSREVVEIGSLYVCRGCLFVVIGGVSGIITGLAVPSHVLAVQLLAAVGGLLASVSLLVRMPKALARLAPAGLGGAALAGALRVSGLAGLLLTLSLLAGAGLAAVLYRRRGPARQPCAACPERVQPAPCSGLRMIVRRERAFQRLTHRWLTSARG